MFRLGFVHMTSESVSFIHYEAHHDPSSQILFFLSETKSCFVAQAGLKLLVLSLSLPLKCQNCVYHYIQIPIQILNKMKNASRAQWNKFVILALERLRQKNGCKFKTNLNYIINSKLGRATEWEYQREE